MKREIFIILVKVTLTLLCFFGATSSRAQKLQLPPYGVIPTDYTSLYFSNENETGMAQLSIYGFNLMGNISYSITVDTFFGPIFQTIGNDVITEHGNYIYFLPQSISYLDGSIRIGGTAIVSKDWQTLTVNQLSGQTTTFTKAVSANTYYAYLARLQNDPDARRIKRDNRESQRQNTNPSHHDNSGSVCTYCGGSGVNPTQSSGGGRQSWVAYYNSSRLKCPYCGRFNAHYHERCFHCNVPSR